MQMLFLTLGTTILCVHIVQQFSLPTILLRHLVVHLDEQHHFHVSRHKPITRRGKEGILSRKRSLDRSRRCRLREKELVDLVQTGLNS